MIRTRLLPWHLAAAAFAFAVAALGGCSVEMSDSTATSSGLVSLTDLIAEFLRAAVAAWVL